MGGSQTKALAEDGYFFRQSSKVHGNLLKLYISKTKLRWESADNKLSVYSQAPDWIVYACNDEKKLVYKCKFEGYQGHLNYVATLSAGSDVQELPVKVVSRGKYLNYSAIVYMLDKAKLSKKSKSHYLQNLQLIQLNDLELSPKVNELVQRIYGTPRAKGLPVSFAFDKGQHTVDEIKRMNSIKRARVLKNKRSHAGVEDNWKTMLRTVESKRVQMPPIPLGIPKGYKVVKLEQDLTRNKGAEQGMQYLLGK